MPQFCRICRHVDRQSIDAAIKANRSSLRIIGAQYGVSKDSLSRHFHTHLEPRRVTEPGQDALPRQVSEPQSQAPKLESIAARYDSFIERFRGKRISRAEVATWGYDPVELEVFIKFALRRGDLHRA